MIMPFPVLQVCISYDIPHVDIEFETFVVEGDDSVSLRNKRRRGN